MSRRLEHHPLTRTLRALAIALPYVLLAALAAFVATGGEIALKDSVWIGLVLAIAFYVSTSAKHD